MSKATPTKKQLPLRPGAGFVVPEEPGAKPYLVASKCGNCGKFFYPSRVICLNCGKQQMETAPLKGTGKLYTYTIVQHQVPGALVTVPYALVLVAMDEECTVRSIVTEDWESLKIGMRMEAHFEKIREDAEGNDLLVCKFRAVNKTKKVR